VEKCGTAGQVRWQCNTVRVLCRLDIYGCRHTHRLCNTCYSSATTMLSRMSQSYVYSYSVSRTV